jgi:hypothetical protein
VPNGNVSNWLAQIEDEISTLIRKESGEEIRQIFQAKGFSSGNLDEIVSVVTGQPVAVDRYDDS